MIDEKLSIINNKFVKNCKEVITYNNQILRALYTKEANNLCAFEYENIGHNLLKEVNYDISYIKMTNIWAQNSYATRKKVGAIFVKHQMIISDGFNGTPRGFPNQAEDENNVSYPYVMHAEQNALSKLACSTQSSKGATLYVSMSPCRDCSKQIIQSKTKKVVFWEFYRMDEGVEWMIRSGINVYYYNSNIMYDLKRS